MNQIMLCKEKEQEKKKRINDNFKEMYLLNVNTQQAAGVSQQEKMGKKNQGSQIIIEVQ